MPVDQDAAGLELIEAGDQLCQRGFARAGVPDNGQVFTGLDGQAEIRQHRFIFSIAEGNVLEADHALSERGTSWLSVWTTFGSASIRAKMRSAALKPD